MHDSLLVRGREALSQLQSETEYFRHRQRAGRESGVHGDA